jgi:hypothetical protein
MLVLIALKEFIKQTLIRAGTNSILIRLNFWISFPCGAQNASALSLLIRTDFDMKRFDVLRKLEDGDLLWIAAATTISEAERAAKKAVASTNGSVVILNRETGHQKTVS